MGVAPSSATASSATSTTAAAPSVICEALPAVIVPSGEKAGRSRARPSAVVSGRTPSSWASGSAPSFAARGAISSARKAADAATRWCEAAANASCASRVRP